MPFTYCTDCGYKNVFTTKRAKFCAGCGQPLVQNAQSSNNPNDITDSTVEEEQSDDSKIPRISKLEYSIDLAKGSHTIGDLINSKKEGVDRVKRKKVTDSEPNLTLEQLEAESIRACSTKTNPPTD